MKVIFIKTIRFEVDYIEEELSSLAADYGLEQGAGPTDDMVLVDAQERVLNFLIRGGSAYPETGIKWDVESTDFKEVKSETAGAER